jgi:hypothetical protein
MCRRRNQRTRTSGKGVIKPPPAEHFRQAEYFDLAPIIERYVKAAGQFAAWIWAEINALSAELINEITTKSYGVEAVARRERRYPGLVR